MRRELPVCRRPAATALLAALPAALLVTLAAVPAGAGSDGHGGSGGSGGVRERAARVVQAHERARERVDRLREADADDAEVEAAERRRQDLRKELWGLLRASARSAGDPVAVDPAGRTGHCPVAGTGDDRRADGGNRADDDGRAGDGTRAEAADTRAEAADTRPEAAGTDDRPPRERADDEETWTVPTRGYWLSAGYAEQGSRWAHRHTGQDFAVPAATPVYAVGPGVVHATTCGDGFGNQVLVRHPDGYFTQYAHLSRIDVRKGRRVEAGRPLGLSGATGNVTGPHLHFEVRVTPYLGSSVPPLPWLRRKAVDVTPPGSADRETTRGK
ncbi:peptidoglycan DD-metalloendopeptidase family protein [Streptomyces sp. NPDC017936]|uniref:peptidoglycan DD-metalloendopeptidase family protein n=1 Tax=Streptomyces sp. NPDC017936 TaxID=3365016 RepID=UPI0037875EB5